MLTERDGIMDSMSNAAKCPAHLLNPAPRKISDLKIGEAGYSWSSFALAVDESGECYLDPAEDLTERSVGAIQVDRRQDGYHVVLISRRTRKWTPRALKKEQAVPVISIAEAYDPDLDDPMTKLRGDVK
jgi:hypothetical protein